MNRSKKKILFLTCWYPNKFDSLCGIFVREHALAIAAEGNDMQVVCINLLKSNSFLKTEIETLKENENLSVTFIHVYSLFHDLLYNFPALIKNVVNKKLNKIVDENEKYLKSYDPKKSVRSNLPHIMHWADHMSTVIDSQENTI